MHGIIFEMFQNHKEKFQFIQSEMMTVQKAAKAGTVERIHDIKDLITLLIAKENMPIRIVESPYFTQLLQSKQNFRQIYMNNFL